MKIKTLLNEAKTKSVEAVLKYFAESGEDDEFIFYDIKDGYSSETSKGDAVLVIARSKDKKKLQLHLEEVGEREATEDQVANLEVYKLQRVY